jgi:large subunit ribosomal protein L31e
MVKLERIYTVPLGKAYESARRKRTPRAVGMLRAFITRHMKADGERILISKGLNTFLWARSIQKPPRRVKVRLIKEEGTIRAYLSDEKIEEPKKADDKRDADKKEEKKDEKADARAKNQPAPAVKAETKKEEKVNTAEQNNKKESK